MDPRKNATRGFRQRESRRQQAAQWQPVITPKEGNNMSQEPVRTRTISPLGIILIILGVLALVVLCCYGPMAIIFWPRQSAAPIQVINQAPTPTQAYVAPANTPIPTQAPASNQTLAPAANIPAWDTTCVAQSKLVGVELKPLAEGPAFACIWQGTPTTITVPANTFADIDLGGVFVAKGLSDPIPGVGRLTLRQWITGQEPELCAHVVALNAYLKTQSGFGIASPYNFTCPAQ
jgi:hypothetical protein